MRTESIPDMDVIAALRLAETATNDWGQFGRVASVILGKAAPTEDDNTGGIEFLISLHAQGLLSFQVDTGEV